MVSAPPIDVIAVDQTGLTVDDLEGRDLPAHWELVEGRLIELAPAGNRSSRIGGRSYRVLAEQGEGRGLGVASPAGAGFVLFPDRGTVRSPDAAFVLAERAVPLDEAGFVPIAPDFAVEVMSPSDRLSDALAKVAMYLQAGMRLVWLVFPEQRNVTVFTQDDLPVTLGVGETLDGGNVLPELRLPVADLFAP